MGKKYCIIYIKLHGCAILPYVKRRVLALVIPKQNENKYYFFFSSKIGHPGIDSKEKVDSSAVKLQKCEHLTICLISVETLYP